MRWSPSLRPTRRHRLSRDGGDDDDLDRYRLAASAGPNSSLPDPVPAESTAADCCDATGDHRLSPEQVIPMLNSVSTTF